MTKIGPVLIESVNADSRLPLETMENLLEKMQNEGLIKLEQDSLTVDTEDRLKLAVKAVTLGADMQAISHLLCWQEFEEMAAFALKSHGYTVSNNVRFKHAGRRYEIDVVGCRKPLVICIDCKHWQHSIGASSLRKIVDDQIGRSEALAESLPNPKINIECTKWEKAKFLPAVISLFPSPFKFYYEVPIVSVLQLNDFLNQLYVHTDILKHFYQKFTTLGHHES